jgi:iron complex transport system substrate-binding protein
MSIPASNRPKVAWGVIYSGKAYVPGSHSFVSEMITLAGGENVFKSLSPANGSVAISLENFFAESKTADIMIYACFPQYAPSIASIIQTAPVLAGIKPIKTGKVWVLQPWYNQQQDRTDQVLYDLAALFYPKQFKDYEVKNFKKLNH